VFITAKALKATAGTLKTIRRLQKVSSAVQSQCIAELKNLAGCLISATPQKIFPKASFDVENFTTVIDENLS